MSLTISHTTKTYPKHDYQSMAAAVLGKTYELSLVFHGATRAQHLNQESRGKSYVPNVLSFPLTKQTGEIYIYPGAAKKEAAQFDLSERGYVAYLFIHGLLHLKGLDHGKEMEQKEQTLLRKFNIR